MAISGQRTYVIRILRGLEKKLADEGYRTQSDVTGRILLHISSTANLKSSLERLYCVDGFEGLALALMWLSTRNRVGVNGLDEEIRGYEMELLERTFPGLQGEEDGEEPNSGGKSISGALHDFSKFIAEAKRRLTPGGRFLGLSEDLLGRVSEELTTLRSAAGFGYPAVTRFCDSLQKFIDYVQDREMFSDIRVLNLVDNANLTLQTVIGAGIAEERDSLEQTILLLQNPVHLFDQLPDEEP